MNTLQGCIELLWSPCH